MQDQWAAGSAYEEFMGRWSQRLAPEFLSWLQVPRGVDWLDVGCGTGALTHAISRQAEPASVTGCDPAFPLIDFARQQCRDTRVSFVTAGVSNLPRCPGGYGSITSLLALNFFPDVEAAVLEMRAVSAARAMISACVWDYGDGMQFLRRFWDAASELDPAARELDEGSRFPLCRRDALMTLFRTSGLRDVRCDPIDIPTVFTSFEDYWRPLLGGTGPAPSYVASLDSHRQLRLARTVEDKLQCRTDGTIALIDRAWAVRGRTD